MSEYDDFIQLKRKELKAMKKNLFGSAWWEPWEQEATFTNIKLSEDGKDASKVTTHIKCSLDLSRFKRQFDTAQYELDSMVMTDMEPYMPMVTGNFIARTKAESAAMAGSGYVCAAAAPYGRFLYEGKTMVSPSTGSTYAKLGEKKVPVSQYNGKTRAKQELNYNRSAHPKVHAYWFDIAKRDHGKEWIRKTKEIAGGG